MSKAKTDSGSVKVEKKKKKKEKAKETDETGKRKDQNQSEGKMQPSFSLLADERTIDAALSSLFAAKATPSAPVRQPSTTTALQTRARTDVTDEHSEDDEPTVIEESENVEVRASMPSLEVNGASTRRRKRKGGEEEVEDVYMRRLARDQAKDAEKIAIERAAKRRKLEKSGDVEDVDAPPGAAAEEDGDGDEDEDEDKDGDGDEGEDDEGATRSPPPRHETEQAAEIELSKANRTVFLGNVSTGAITSNSSRKILLDHLRSFFPSVSEPKANEPKHSVESLRFRSTPYASAIPKKAAFAKKDVMDATSKSTNAYAVYSTQALAREATKRLNGTIVLGRHLRVDSVAHPAPVDHKRCVFVGNLGFVDDESHIIASDEHEKRKPSKHPQDAEEGLWQTFGKCGTVESVRVIRDSTTRVGKGIAYVQFVDENAVESALLFDGQKFPPLLPRRLRVSRAKAMKRNPKPGSGRAVAKSRTTEYQRKVPSEEASRMGRAGKLLGKAGQANMKSRLADGPWEGRVKKAEDFVFEGHRARKGKGGVKVGGRKKGKPGGRSARRGAAFKAAGRKAKS